MIIIFGLRSDRLCRLLPVLSLSRLAPRWLIAPHGGVIRFTTTGSQFRASEKKIKDLHVNCT